MNILESEISCGVQQLVEIGPDPTLEEYKAALIEGFRNNSHKGLGCFIIASVPLFWRNSVKFLKSVGFKSHGVLKNPNSDNKIVLFSKTLTLKERLQFKGRNCSSCNDEVVTGRRRICDYCKQEKQDKQVDRSASMEQWSY